MENSNLSELAIRAKKNKKYIGDLYEQTFDSIYRYVYWKVGNKEDAEDIVSNIYFDLIGEISKYDETKSSFRTWLYVIARNKTIDFIRRKYKNVTTTIDEYANDLDVSNDESDISIFMSQVCRIVKEKFPSRQQELFALRYSNGLTNKEIAELLDLDEKSVSSTLSKVVNKLKEMMLSGHTKF